MTLRKTTIDNSVKYIPSTNSSQSEKFQDQKPKTVSKPSNQIKKKLSQKNKKFVKDIVTG